MNKRPLSVTIIGCVYILVGAIGFTYHFPELMAPNSLRSDTIWVEVVRLAAIVFGAFMLRGNNWARWLALGWIGFHVILSAFHTIAQFAIHVVFFAILAYFLFRTAASRYFR
jgi:hypothetical protein